MPKSISGGLFTFSLTTSGNKAALCRICNPRHQQQRNEKYSHVDVYSMVVSSKKLGCCLDAVSRPFLGPSEESGPHSSQTHSVCLLLPFLHSLIHSSWFTQLLITCCSIIQYAAVSKVFLPSVSARIQWQ